MKNIKQLFSQVRKGSELFGHSIATLINSILLLFVYIVGVGLTSVVARTFGKNFLDMKIEKSKKSYWHDLNLKKKKNEEYYRQF